MDINSFRPEDMPVSLNASRWTMKVHSLSPTDTFLLQILKKTKNLGIVRPMFIQSSNALKYGLVLDVKLMWQTFRLQNHSNIKHHRAETFLSQVLNSFQSGEHSSIPKEDQVIDREYRHGHGRTRNTHLGVKCMNFKEGIKLLRIAFAKGCRTPVEIVFPSS
jgi:hypothetical protein